MLVGMPEGYPGWWYPSSTPAVPARVRTSWVHRRPAGSVGRLDGRPTGVSTPRPRLSRTDPAVFLACESVVDRCATLPYIVASPDRNGVVMPLSNGGRT